MRGTTSLLLTAVLVVLFGSAWAADYVAMDFDWACYNYINADLLFYLLHESGQPAVLTSGFNGFVITIVGDAAYEMLDIVPHLALPDGEMFYGIDDYEGVAPDTFFVGFTSPTGVPVMTAEEPYFSLVMNTGDAGLVCIDTTWVPPDNAWSWSGPGGSITPQFLNSNHEGGSPHCFELMAFVCELPVITIEPPDCLEIHPDCGGIAFEFRAEPVYDFVYCAFYNFRVLEGPGTVATVDCTTYVYTCPPLQAGTYHVLVEAEFCCEYDYSEFDVIFLDGERPLGDCDCSAMVDIDDIVYLIAFIFSGGPEPYANPDCTGIVDIDDVVYLIEYVFSGGPEPCG